MPCAAGRAPSTESPGRSDPARAPIEPDPYSAMHGLPLRLEPGADLRASLEAMAQADGLSAFVVCGIGSLAGASLRLAPAGEWIREAFCHVY